MIFPEINAVKTGKNIAKFREAKGLSKKDLAKLMYIQLNTIYIWEGGVHCPSLENLVILANIFKVKLDDIIVIEVNDE